MFPPPLPPFLRPPVSMPSLFHAAIANGDARAPAPAMTRQRNTSPAKSISRRYSVSGNSRAARRRWAGGVAVWTRRASGLASGWWRRGTVASSGATFLQDFRSSHFAGRSPRKPCPRGGFLSMVQHHALSLRVTERIRKGTTLQTHGLVSRAVALGDAVWCSISISLHRAAAISTAIDR